MPDDKAKKGKTAEKSGDNKGGAGGTTKKTAKKGVIEEAGAKSKNVSVLDEAAMENAYNICHNVQDLLYFRDYIWFAYQIQFAYQIFTSSEIFGYRIFAYHSKQWIFMTRRNKFLEPGCRELKKSV